MAIDLKAVFRVRDEGTSKLRKIMQQTEKLSKSTQQATKATNTYRDANGRLRDSMGRFVSEANRAASANSRFATSLSGVRVGSNGVSASLQGMQSALFGIVGAYAVAQGAASAFNATIGAAARYEQSEVTVNAIFNDKEASSAYLEMVDKMAIDSPLLSSGEMLSSSKGLVAMTKNVSDLGDAWSVIERLMVLDPTQGTDGAAFALKEMWQGDSLSMVERFGLNKKELNRIKKLAIPQQIAEISKLLDGMGITQSTVNAMGETTLGYWAQIQERAQKFMRTIGESGNSKLGDSLGKIVDIFDNTDMDAMAAGLGDTLGTIVDKAIIVGQWLWKWREPVLTFAAALTAALGAFVAVGAISLLANPIALIAAGIAAAAVGFKALYDNSETFRGFIDGLVGKAKALYEAFQNGGTEGLVDRLFGSGTFEKVAGIIDPIKTKIGELFSAFQTGGMGGLLDALFGEGTAEKVTGIIDTIKTKFDELKVGFEIVKNALWNGWVTVSGIFSSVWAIIGPILELFGSFLSVIGDIAVIVFNNVIAPALQFIMQLFSTLWSIVSPILTILGAMFEVFGAIIKWLWDTILAPLVEFILGGLKNAFDTFSDALSIVAGWFEKVGGWAETAKGYISDFADMISSIKLPDWVTNGISTVVSTVGKAIGAGGGSGKSHSHYHGIDYVPRDQWNSTLHKGEAVLTAQENKEYQAAKKGGGFGGGVTITGNTFNVREEADIEKIAYKLAKYVEKEAMQVG